MAYTTEKLITGAYYASGIVAREFNDVSGTQINDGLDYLNEILSQKRVENNMIPYYSEYTFNTVVGQETYDVPDLIDAETITFVLDTVRYQMTNKPRTAYFGTPRANDIKSLPLTFHVERKKGGADVYLYFLPDQVYPMTIWGLFDLKEVALNQDLTVTLDRFYITYLRYALADRLCTEFDYDVPPGVVKTLATYQSQISKRSQQIDLRMTKVPMLGSSQGFSYAQANIGKGWTAP